MWLPNRVLLWVHAPVNVTLRFRPTDTFEAVKLAIAHQLRIPPLWQTLHNLPEWVLYSCGIPAPGCFCDFDDYSTLEASFLHGGYRIPEGAHAALSVEFGGGPVDICRSNWILTPLPVKVFFTDRILEIKERIERSESIPVSRQRLFFRDCALDDQLRLDEMPPPQTLVRSGTHFRLAVIAPIRLWIQPLIGKKFSVEVNQDDLIKEVKAKIEAATSIEVKGQHLFWGWRELFDRDTLRDWCIENDFTVHLTTAESESEWKSQRGPGKADETNQSIHIQIHKLNAQATISLTVRQTDVIQDAISRLGSYDPTKLLSGQDPGLWLGGLKLDRKSTFGEIVIQEGTTLHFEICHPCQIFVKGYRGNWFTLQVSLGDTVEVVRRLIQYKEGAPVEEQRLVFGTTQLEDGKTLRAFHIHDSDALHLMLRLRAGG
jgi:hypothetical protein